VSGEDIEMESEELEDVEDANSNMCAIFTGVW